MRMKWLSLLTAVICLLTGCTGEWTDAHADGVLDSTVSEQTVIEYPVYEWGVTLTVEDITSTGLTIVCTQSGGEAKGELQTGSWYVIQQLENGMWKKVMYTEIDESQVGWTGEAWCIPANSTVEWVVDWSWLYGSLPKGQYRIGKEIMDFTETGKYDEAVIYAEFTIA